MTPRLLSVIPLFAASGLAQAQHRVEYGMNLSLDYLYVEDYRQGAEPSGEIAHEEVIPDYGRILGKANVGFGVNRARVDLATTNPDNPVWFDYGFSSSRYWDTFTFDDPELNGTHGFFDVTLFVAGNGSINLSQNMIDSPDTELDAFWHAVINVFVEGVDTPTGPIQSGFYAGQWYKGFDSNTLDYYGDPLNTYQQTVTFEFIYGEPIFMDTFLQLYIFMDNQYAQVPGTLDASIDLGNSSYWGGITNLRDRFGNPVGTAAYASSSGFDYRLPCAPVINAQPAAGQACPGAAASFSLGASSANPIAYAWQIETAPGEWTTLSDQPQTLPCGGSAFASAPASSATQITVNPCAGVSAYRVRASAATACGVVESEPATFAVQSITGDADADGQVAFGDVSAALAAWGNDYSPGTGPGDANGDGVVDFGDITATLANFGRSCK